MHSRIEEEKRAAAERHNKRLEEQERKKKLEQRQQPPAGPRGRPEGAEVVQGAQGWKPMEVGVTTHDTTKDPMIQQMNNIKAYIKQAKHAGKWDEVQMLDENLKMLQQEYWRQAQAQHQGGGGGGS